jgi:hypothetical protein
MLLLEAADAVVERIFMDVLAADRDAVTGVPV